MSFYVASIACGGIAGSVCAHETMRQELNIRMTQGDIPDRERIKQVALEVMKYQDFGFAIGMAVGGGVALAFTVAPPFIGSVLSAAVIYEGLKLTRQVIKAEFNAHFA